MTKHRYNHDLAQRDDFVVRFSCEANWDRFADERNDPELAEVVTKAVKAELKKRADKEPAPVPTPVAPAPQPEPDDDAVAVEFSEPTEGPTPP
jgi:hypothetical protein